MEQKEESHAKGDRFLKSREREFINTLKQPQRVNALGNVPSIFFLGEMLRIISSAF